MKGLGNDGPYWDALRNGKVQLPKCSKCGVWHWPAPYRCGHCGSWEMDWQDVEMKGGLYTWTRAMHPFDGTENLGARYVTVLVELPHAGGIRLLGLLKGDAEPKIGMSLTGSVGESRVFDQDIPVIHWRAAA